MLHWQLDLLNEAVDNGNLVGEAVLGDDVPAVHVDARLLDAVDVLGPALG